MRVILQRVKKAGVSINNEMYSSIEAGLLILLGIEEADSDADIQYLVSKIIHMRIFSDGEGKMNLDVQQVAGDLLVVSQFTLHASTKKGNRPSFIRAARPDKAIPLYNRFIDACKTALDREIKTGEFGADMQVELVNDGPVTIILDSRNKE